MSQILFSPIKMRFVGLDAEQHHLDAEQFGRSVLGTAKLYNAATSLFYTGVVPVGRARHRIRMHTSAQLEQGSVCYAIYASMVLGEMAMFPQLWGELADTIVPSWVKAVYAKLVHRDNEIKLAYEKTIHVLQEENQRNRQHVENLQQMAFDTLLKSQDNFVKAITTIAENSLGAARDSVATIGRTSTQIEHHSNTHVIVQLDQPIADALRSKEELEVIDTEYYSGKIVEAARDKKSCRIILDGSEKAITAKIDDPAIEQTGNIYTHALDQNLRVRVQAKATIKDTEIKTLYISSAEEQSD